MRTNIKTIDNYNEDNLTYNAYNNNSNNAYYDNFAEKNNSIITSSQRSQKFKRKIKFDIEENPQTINDNINDFLESEKKIEQNQKRTIVENAFRNKLFNRIKRNKSVGSRKNK
jgi:predicted transcriptional regulator